MKRGPREGCQKGRFIVSCVAVVSLISNDFVRPLIDDAELARLLQCTRQLPWCSFYCLPCRRISPKPMQTSQEVRIIPIILSIITTLMVATIGGCAAYIPTETIPKLQSFEKKTEKVAEYHDQYMSRGWRPTLWILSLLSRC